MATFIPKNAKQILTNAAKARDYFLKPYGLDEVNDNVLTFKADEKLAKP